VPDDASVGVDAFVQDGRHPDAPGTGTPPRGPHEDDGGCCSAAGVDPRQHLPLVLVMAMLLLRRRRRE